MIEKQLDFKKFFSINNQQSSIINPLRTESVSKCPASKAMALQKATPLSTKSPQPPQNAKPLC
jgi:hypothetical protein